MNLLNYQNRFRNLPFAPANMDKIHGYQYAMQDVLKLMEEMTGFQPSRRFIDSADITNAIGETIAALAQAIDAQELGMHKALKDVDLNSDKVKEFLKDQI